MSLRFYAKLTLPFHEIFCMYVVKNQKLRNILFNLLAIQVQAQVQLI